VPDERSAQAALHPLTLGIVAGLFFGKPLGIFTATRLAVACNIAPIPHGVSWRLIYAIATIAGIGFTMSLFIGQLAFPHAKTQQAITLGILAASCASALIGVLLLRHSLRQRE
jgi:NhaA family Na+:H+ antiporter